METAMKLDDIFFSFEGNNWFKRNKDSFNIKNDVPLKLMEIYNLKPKRVIELGCSNGWRLNQIQKKLGKGVYCAGVDAGAEAIDDGAKNFPDIVLRQGLLSNIPFSEEFDLAIVNFVLHWVDRSTLLKSISEIDSLVKEGGYLIIGDFYPDFPQKRNYHHLQEKVYTWKTLYNKILTSSNLYKEIAFISYDHDKKFELTPDAEGNRRGFCSLLKKSNEKYYFEL